MPELHSTVSSFAGKGYVVAPAGYGKTHLIAEAVGSASAGTELVLTHTYAGVNAIKGKLRKLGVEPNRFAVDTIASWCLRLCSAYPERSDWHVEQPDGQEWLELYAKTRTFLEKDFVKRIIRCSYSGVYIDEYQDCTSSQHAIVLQLAEILSCRVLGDPLQGIFDIGAEQLVDWPTQVLPHFEHLGELDIPWRWREIGDPELGDWLNNVRQNLDAGVAIDLSAEKPASVSVHITNSDEELRNKQINVCKYFNLADGENAIAIHKGDNQYKAKCQKLAKNTSGSFSSIEEVEGKRLLQFVRALDQIDNASDRLLALQEFARAKCMSGVNSALSLGTRRGEVVVIRGNTKNPALVEAANRYLEDPKPTYMINFLKCLSNAPEVVVYARDLFYRVLRVFGINADNPDETITEAAIRFQREFRHSGRPIRYPKLIGTTLLVKGLEFDHAIVLDAASLSKKDLYVAMTRGSKSLTIISSSAILDPTA